MDIPVMRGGNTLSRHRSDSLLPAGLDPAQARLSRPGNLDGNVALAIYVDAMAKKEHGLPTVARVRIIFMEYTDGIRLLIIPLKNKDDESGEATADAPNTYEWKLHKKCPRVTGLGRLFDESGIPLREDQWYWCTAELVQDDVEGYCVALDWTHARLEPRDIVAERQQRAEAERQRRQRRKAEKQGEAKP